MGTLRSFVKQAAGDGVVVEYDPVLHAYRVDGRAWPSVTQILDQLVDLSAIPEYVLRRAGDRGSKVHGYCDMINQTYAMDHTFERQRDIRGAAMEEEEWVTRRVLAYFDFMDNERPEVLASEVTVAHRLLRYCGRTDLAAKLKGHPSMIDIKTGAVISRTFGPQTAAYAHAYAEHKCTRRYVLHLGEAGYRLLPYTDPTDLTLFISALNVWRFKNDPH